MHKLDRAGVTPPACLTGYGYPAHTWEDLGRECKRELRAALVRMQGEPGVTTPDANEYGLRCAYCEGRVLHEGHIEHFRRKSPLHFPQLTFAWSNLFLACGSNDHCGHYKDRKGTSYDSAALLKPDQDEPDDYLHFHSSGQVRVREGLEQADAHRASETIRVFGLDNPTLKGARAKALSVYKKKVVGDLDELASWTPADRQAYLAGEIAQTRYEPYATTVKHFLQRSA
ncbi:retron system putative HNH endonuclease [Roseateles chitinivorans]|uniref:retron system putative HNH endonuclease n=1 Tax=Roseateles chitinivorans TaxID=2917965 RepID=UPI003D674516